MTVVDFGRALFPHPSSQDFIYGPDFADAPVDYWCTEDALILTVEGHVMTKDMYHRLPECRDWEGLMNGDVAILGRIELDPGFLDLVVMDAKDGYLRSAFISSKEAKSRPKAEREFMLRCWRHSPIIRIYETLNKRRTK